MKITRRQIRRIIKEEKQRMLKEYSDYPSWADLSDTLSDELSVFEDLEEKYVRSGWLRENDREDLTASMRSGIKILRKLLDDVEDETFSNRTAR